MTTKTPVRFVSYSGMSMASHGYDAKICKADSEIKPGVYIFSKHFNPKEEYNLLKKLQDPEFVIGNVTHTIAGEEDAGSVIIFDICDNHFGNSELANYYKTMIGKADIVVAATGKMADIVKKECREELGEKPIVVISDPYEFPEKEPRFNWQQQEVENLLWYGHPTNIKHLQRIWNDIGDHNLMIITQAGTKLDVDGVPFPVVPYSIDSLLWGFSQCDVVIIPNDGMDSAKGANRIIEAIRQGIFVVAEPCPAYQEFDKFMYIGNIKEGLKWCKANKGEIQGRIQKAQDHIREKYAPKQITEQWSKLIKEAVEIKSSRLPQEKSEKAPCGLEEVAAK